jgi:anti-sigma factor RsiW
MNLDHDLKRALRSESPAPGFANRVLARIEQEEARAARPRPSWWRAAAASVALAAIVGGWAAGNAIHERAERRAEGEKAKEQVLQALAIAGSKVRYAQQEVRNIGSHD